MSTVKGNAIAELRSITCHMGSHSVICYPTQVNALVLTLARQTGTRFIFPWKWKAELTLVFIIYLDCLNVPQTVAHPSSKHLTATRPAVKPTTSRSYVC